MTIHFKMLETMRRSYHRVTCDVPTRTPGERVGL